MTDTPETADSLFLTQEGTVATLWLNQPEKRNAVSYSMWTGLANRCEALAGDPAIRVLVIRGVGDHFCAGADLTGLDAAPAEDYQRANREAEAALAMFPKPTIAYLQGACVGAGVELAVACDIRLADTTARFCLPPSRLGIVYPSYALERLIGVIGADAARYLLYTAETIDSSRARELGLVTEVVEKVDSDSRLETMVKLLSEQRSFISLQATKEMTREIEAQGSVGALTADKWQTRSAESGDPAKGIAAFLNRRPPNFV